MICRDWPHRSYILFQLLFMDWMSVCEWSDDKALGRRRVKNSSLLVQGSVQYSQHIVAKKKRLNIAAKEYDGKLLEERCQAYKFEPFPNVLHDLNLEGGDISDYQNSERQRQKLISELYGTCLLLFHLPNGIERMKIFKFSDTIWSVF